MKPDSPLDPADSAHRCAARRRRDFLRTMTLLSPAVITGCTTSANNLPQGRKAIAIPSEASCHQSYGSFLASLRLRYLTPDEVIEPHFNSCRGVSNCLPPRSLWANIVPTLRMAEEIRRRLGVRLERINSAYRNPAYNARIRGSASSSYHIRNMALDLRFACAPSSAARIVAQLRKERKFAGGLGIYRRFIHIDTRGSNTTWYG
jgi:hypothetical protein